MKMGEVGIGLGLGVKDFRAVFIFHDRATLTKFINSGWEFGGHADAAAKAGDKGAAVGGEALIDGITIYQLTKSGLALQVTVKGTRRRVELSNLSAAFLNQPVILQCLFQLVFIRIGHLAERKPEFLFYLSHHCKRCLSGYRVCLYEHGGIQRL